MIDMKKTFADEFNNSHIYFYTPSQTAKDILYYPTVAGKYVCDESYYVKRESYDSILALYVLEGGIILNQADITYRAEAGELLLIDCYEPHEYYSASYAKTLWVHFDGSNSREWFNSIKAKKGQKIAVTLDFAENITAIIDGIKDGRDEYTLSELVYSLLCGISKAEDTKESAAAPEFVTEAKRYIKSNIQNELTVEELANAVHLSASHFSKIFKEATGFSPYLYIVNTRIELAKKLLIQTKRPISVIASDVGFGSEANFIYCFKKKINSTQKYT